MITHPTPPPPQKKKLKLGGILNLKSLSGLKKWKAFENRFTENFAENIVSQTEELYSREKCFFRTFSKKSFLNCLRNETDKDAEGDGFDIVNKHCEWTIRKVDDIALGFDRD